MSWEQQITEQLQEVQNMAVRFDVSQQLTDNEKNVARSNIGIGASVSLISDDEYKIML